MLICMLNLTAVTVARPYMMQCEYQEKIKEAPQIASLFRLCSTAEKNTTREIWNV